VVVRGWGDVIRGTNSGDLMSSMDDDRCVDLIMITIIYCYTLDLTYLPKAHGLEA
jgi:hypothetical protein